MKTHRYGVARNWFEGMSLIWAESARRASTSGLKPSASHAADGRRIRTGMPRGDL